MKKTTTMLISAMAALALTACDNQGSGGDSGYELGPEEALVAMVDGQPIPESRIKVYSPAGMQAPPEQKALIVENMIKSELIAKEAEKLGLENNANVREQLVVARQAVLGQEYVRSFIDQNPVSAAQVRERYEKIKEDFEGKIEYLAEHILVPTQEAADELQAKVAKNPDSFADLALEHSEDTASAQNGGQLGWSVPEIYVEPFQAAIVSLEPGDLFSDPVRTQFGWHIIRLADSREMEVPDMTPEMEDRIRLNIQQEMVAAEIEKIRAAAVVSISE